MQHDSSLRRLAHGRIDHLRDWLRTSHSMLGGESPLVRMDTVAGMNEVKTMLYPIECGLPA